MKTAVLCRRCWPAGARTKITWWNTWSRDTWTIRPTRARQIFATITAHNFSHLMYFAECELLAVFIYLPKICIFGDVSYCRSDQM